MSTVQTHVELKGLQTRLERAKAEWNEAERDLAIHKAKAVQAKERVTALEGELKRFKETQAIVVSEHALLRYLERVKGINMEEIRQEILQPEVVQAIQHFRGGLIPANGFRLRVRDKTVTTIMVDGEED